MKHTKNTNRRDFLKLAGALGANSIVAPLSINLASMSSLAAASADDYKALVCVFLYGGNDHNNTIIPADNTHYPLYQAIRPDIAINQADLVNTKLNITNGLPSNNLELALNPSMTALKTLFDQDKLALLFNVGTLNTPVTLSQFKNKSVPLPPSLFSHNDQQSLWQSFQPEGAKSGWGGKALEAVNDASSSCLFTSISTRGNHVFLSGENTKTYQLVGNGGIPIYGARKNDYLYRSKLCAENFRKLLMQQSDNIVANEYRNITSRSLEAESIIKEGINTIDSTLLNTLDSLFPAGNSLATQLKSVAGMMAIKDRLDQPIKRQVFMVSIGGFDHHDNLLGSHGGLLAQVSEAMAAFYKATEALNLENAVTSFTASDFGRTFTSNGDGSDHGWGSHHMIMGGAVRGGNVYGNLPEYALDTSVDTGRGRLLPTTSTSSYIATLAQWFGVSERDLDTVLPYIHNFDQTDLGFMQGHS